MKRVAIFVSAAMFVPAAVFATTPGTQATLPAISDLRGTDLSSYTDVAVSGYYGPGTAGGGNFTKITCASDTTSGWLDNGAAKLRNYGGPLYAGEAIAKASYLPSNTTVLSTGFFSLRTAGSYHSSTAVSHVWDTTNVVIGMNVSGSLIKNNTTVAAVSAPSPTYTITGKINNGARINYTGSLSGSVVVGMVIRMTANNDTHPKVLPQNAISPGSKILSINTTLHQITIDGPPVVGITVSDATFEASDGGSITLSQAPNNGTRTDQDLWIYEPEATLSANSLQDTTGQTLTVNDDNGGTQVNDSVGHCFHRVAPPADVRDWGAKCTGVDSDNDTGFITNNETWAEISTPDHGFYGAVRLPNGNPCVASSIWVQRAVRWSGGGRDQSVLLQKQGTHDALLHVLPWHASNDVIDFNTYPGFEPSLQDVTLRGSDGDARNFGLLADGLANVPAAPSAYHIYMRNVTIEGFPGNLIQVNRNGGEILRGYDIQLKGVGFSNGTDCLHVDGPADTSRFYILVASQCDYGQYLLNTTAWAEFGVDMFDNNSAVFVSGSAWPGSNNPGVKFYDFQFDSNKHDGFVVDSNGATVICDLCRSQGVGVGDGSGTHLYSDYSVTANAGSPAGDPDDPVLILRGNLFTGVATSNWPQLYNIFIDPATTAVVEIDGDVTTTDPTNHIYTNLASQVVGPDFHANPIFASGVALTSPVLTTPLLGTGKVLSFGSDYTSASPCIFGNGSSALQLQNCDSSGYLNVRGNSFRVNSGSNYTQIQAATSVPTTYNFTLPGASGTDMYTLASSGGGAAMQWLDWSRIRSGVTNGTGTTFTVTGSPTRWNISIAYAFFDIERSGPGSSFSDTFDTATNIVNTLGAANLSAGSTLRGVVCNNAASGSGITETLVAGTGVTLSGTTTVTAGTCLHLAVIVTNVGAPAVTIVGG